uniref:Immunoglobulin domain-containing protein n=1 Tax=Dicentrarchus labrax TaxID=13489 RepID=A0A8C4NJ76_DICLA
GGGARLLWPCMVLPHATEAPVFSEVSVKAGDSITIPCLYESKYINHVKFLCKGYYWTSCSYAVKTNKPSSGKFLISDDKSQRIFTVTINDLTDQDTDYWCAVEIDGVPDVREYFHLSVTRGKRDLKASLCTFQILCEILTI